MSNSRYTIPVNKYGYVLDGLELLLDGKDNVGTGSHDNSSTIWKDLSGKGRDGTLMNMDLSNAWSNDGLNFDGIDDYVPIDEMNYDNITLECVATPKVNKNSEGGMSIISNIESGGYLIYAATNIKAAFSVYIQEKK